MAYNMAAPHGVPGHGHGGPAGGPGVAFTTAVGHGHGVGAGMEHAPGMAGYSAAAMGHAPGMAAYGAAMGYPAAAPYAHHMSAEQLAWMQHMYQQQMMSHYMQ